jgi:glycosyltransferase involved in cell wall biosynthesis
MPALVSILIPCYNSAAWLAETLESALAQTWPNTEIIVVDDGSTDDSLGIARSFEAQGVTVIAQENQGACAARNRALREAQGEYIQFLDADDLMTRYKIERQMKRLATEPPGSVALAPWGAFRQDPEEATFEKRPVERDFETPVDWLLMHGRGRGGTRYHAWLTPREIVEEVGPWNEALRINQDGEYFARVLLNSEKIAFCPEARVYYRTGVSESVSSRQTEDALASLLHSFELITDHILQHEDSLRTRRACATQCEQFAYDIYPRAPHLIKAAQKRSSDLGGGDYTPSSGSRLFEAVRKVAGWRWAKRAQHVYRQFRYER